MQSAEGTANDEGAKNDTNYLFCLVSAEEEEGGQTVGGIIADKPDSEV